MRTGTFLTAAFVVTCALCSHAAFGTECQLPDELRAQMAKRYPEARVVSLSDLGAEDRALFAKEHGDACPGLTTLDFYGDGEPALAVDLVTGKEQAGKALLVVAHQVDGHWNIRQIGSAKSSTPVVWNDKPGEYRDVYGTKKLQATRPVIVWCAYDAWAVVYAWTGSGVSKVWLAD